MKTSFRVLAVFVLVAVALTCVASAAGPGRYKKQGVACVWDANDNGPDNHRDRIGADAGFDAFRQRSTLGIEHLARGVQFGSLRNIVVVHISLEN